jgi:hypothetical protein
MVIFLNGKKAAILAGVGAHHGGMTGTPTTCYASGPRGALAYQVTGTGPIDLLMVPGMHSHLELQWQLPGYRRFVRGLSRHCRLGAGPPAAAGRIPQ